MYDIRPLLFSLPPLDYIINITIINNSRIIHNSGLGSHNIDSNIATQKQALTPRQATTTVRAVHFYRGKTLLAAEQLFLPWSPYEI